jgi:hypothetical protein
VEYPQVRDVEIEQTGVGPDGGKDILLTFSISGTIATYSKKWVIQCKFYSDTVKPSDLKDDNLPTLIHSYGANGYLLICKNNVSQKLAEEFKRLNQYCLFRYQYKIWNGDFFRSRIINKDDLLKTYFPKYYSINKST